METALTAVWSYVRRLPPAWRGPVTGLLVVAGIAAWAMMSDGYETQSAHAADISRLETKIQNLPATIGAAVWDEKARRDDEAKVRAKAKRKGRK